MYLAKLHEVQSSVNKTKKFVNSIYIQNKTQKHTEKKVKNRFGISSGL